MVSVDVKQHVYLLTYLILHRRRGGHAWVGGWVLFRCACERSGYTWMDGCAVLRNKKGGYTRMNGLLRTVTAQQKGWLRLDERVVAHSYCATKGVATPG